MSTKEASEEIKAMRVLPISGLQQDWDEWSEKYQGIAAERGYLQVMLGKEDVPMDALNIDQQVESKYLIPEAERKQEKSERISRLAAVDIQVSLPTCFSCKDGGASKWICGQRLGICQG